MRLCEVIALLRLPSRPFRPSNGSLLTFILFSFVSSDALVVIAKDRAKSRPKEGPGVRSLIQIETCPSGYGWNVQWVVLVPSIRSN